MTTRDELEALIDAAMDDLDEFYGPGTAATGERILNEILARWRLVPVDGAPYVEPDAVTMDCPACKRPAGQPCYEIIDIGNGIDLGPYDLNPGSYHHARQNAANERAAAQHCAADELTHHDIDTGTYE